MNRSIPKCLLAGVSIAAAVMAQPARAEQNFTFLNSGANYLAVNLLHDGTVAAGRYKGQLGSNTYNIFCTDFTNWINWGQTYDTLSLESRITDQLQNLNQTNVAGHYFYQSTPGAEGSAGGLKSAMQYGPNAMLDYYRNRSVNGDGPFSTGPGSVSGGLGAFTIDQRVQGVAYLTDKYLNDLSLSTPQVAGVQLAIWDIIQDGGDGFAAGKGYVQAGSNSGNALTALADALGYETEVANRLNQGAVVSSTARWIQAVRDARNPDPDHPQDFAYIADSHIHIDSVPEPAFYQMTALCGLGSVGLLRLRSRKNR